MSDAHKAVFLSYASQDAEAAKRIADVLRAAGVEVWFDQSELVGGDAWDAKIRKQIKDCALLIPIISANTQSRTEGYFRLEWRLADQRTHLMAKGRPFLLPVVIDDTGDAEAHVPDSFTEVQWTRLPGGEIPAAFCARVKRLLGGDVAPAASGRSDANESSNVGQGPAPPRKRSWAWGIAAVTVAIAVGGYFWLKRPMESAPIPTLNAGAEPALSSTYGPNSGAVSDKSLVVLPLENLSPDPENAFFTDGMHSEIISTLQRLADLKVISRSSALEFKSTTPLLDVATKLGVAHAITGSVRRANGQVRIQLELRRTNDEALVWTQTYNKALDDILAIQSDIATDVARVLQARERKGFFGSAQFMTNNPQALDLFLKANQSLVDRGVTGGYEEMMGWLDEALRLDPHFMSAASLLSTFHNLQFRVKRDPRQRAYHAAEAKRWAETASRLVPGGAGDSALAAYNFWIAGDPARGLALIDNAVRALPNDSEPLNRRGIALSRLGRENESAAAFDEALKIDPLNPLIRRNQLGAFATLRRTKEFDAALADLALRSPVRVAGPDVASARFVMRGELPGSLEGWTASQKILWLGRTRRPAEQLAVIQTELGAPGLTDADAFPLRIVESDALSRLARKPEAVEAARKALALAEKLRAETEVNPADTERRLALALVRVGRIAEAVAAQRRVAGAYSAQTRPADRWTAEIGLAELYSYAGRAHECVETLAPLLRVPSRITVPMLRVDPTWDNVREDAVFKALLDDPKNSVPL